MWKQSFLEDGKKSLAVLSLINVIYIKRICSEVFLDIGIENKVNFSLDIFLPAQNIILKNF